jgi:tyrosine-protein kinase Etk/Wzc
MRAPDIHRIFGIASHPGLCELLQGDCSIDDVIGATDDQTLHILTAGELDCSPHRLVGSNAFGLLVEKFRQTYDYIVIDTPPILAASESLLIASAADAAIVCVRRDFSRVDQVVEAYSRLQSAGVNTAGAVLNGVPMQTYAYRYGSYYYRTGRSERDSSIETNAALPSLPSDST